MVLVAIRRRKIGSIRDDDSIMPLVLQHSATGIEHIERFGGSDYVNLPQATNDFTSDHAVGELPMLAHGRET